MFSERFPVIMLVFCWFRRLSGSRTVSGSVSFCSVEYGFGDIWMEISDVGLLSGGAKT